MQHDPRSPRSFEEFWDLYVSLHTKKGTRIAHFVGTTAAMGCVAWGVLSRRKWPFVLAPVVGYAPAWLAHWFIEKNQPATFSHPLWSLRADLRMWWKTLNGEMQEEVDRVLLMKDLDGMSSDDVESSFSDRAEAYRRPVDEPIN